MEQIRLVAELAKKVPCFCGTQVFITVCTRTDLWTTPYVTCGPFLILSFQLLQGYPKGLFPSHISTTILYASSVSSVCCLTLPSHHTWFYHPQWFILIGINREVPHYTVLCIPLPRPHFVCPNASSAPLDQSTFSLCYFCMCAAFFLYSRKVQSLPLIKHCAK